jgi:DNA polymerase III epsilon subunit-like protein
MNHEPVDISNLVAIDFETGGLTPGVHPPLQLSAVTASGAEFNCYILPEKGAFMEVEALAKNGYTRERWMALGAVPMYVAAARFRDWLYEVTGFMRGEAAPLVPLAHNATFDRSFLDVMMRASGYSGSWSSEVLDYHWECSSSLMAALRRAGLLWPGKTRLAVLRELSGYELDGQHAALSDAKACLHGYRWLLELARTGHVVEEH